MMSRFLDLFEEEKPIIGMLHLGRRSNVEEALALTISEMETYLENGIDGVIVEDYFGDQDDVIATLKYLYENQDYYRNEYGKNIIYGINYLRDYQSAFILAKEYDAKFIQIDSISGHLKPDDDKRYEENLEFLREWINIPVIGGVRFKYQPYLSGRSLEEDLLIGMQRSDGIVVTGPGTGFETPVEKAKLFKKTLNDFPLIIGAGLTPDNCIEILSVGDGAIVGSYIKDNHQDRGKVSAENIQRLIKKINTIK